LVSAGFGPRDLLACYARGVFPMADGRDDPRLFLVNPDIRGIIPLDGGFHVPRRLARTVRSDPFELRLNSAFDAVVEGCASAGAGRDETWINQPIRQLYGALHRMGHAHSLECWQDGQLAGGLYGVSLGGAFFGESMFSRATDASKVALVHLVAGLRQAGVVLLDTQFQTAHLARFGTREIPRAAYHERLRTALALATVRFPADLSWQAHWPLTGAQAVELATRPQAPSPL
jgi:leucyl/phenylalanyl-tRNA--protein transferase